MDYLRLAKCPCNPINNDKLICPGTFDMSFIYLFYIMFYLIIFFTIFNIIQKSYPEILRVLN